MTTRRRDEDSALDSLFVELVADRFGVQGEPQPVQDFLGFSCKVRHQGYGIFTTLQLVQGVLVRGIDNVRKIVSLFGDVRAIKALATWPKFSFTSYFLFSSLAKQGISPRTVLDIGANVGQAAVASAKLFPNAQVHSFEPLPSCVKQLQRNVSGLRNVTVYPFALGAEEGKIPFNVNSYSHSSSILPVAQTHRDAFPEAREEKAITVKVSTLDEISRNIALRTPVLLKLDVQGYEDRVLRGGAETLKYVDHVVLEASFKPMYEGESLFMDIARTMEQLGFRFERPVSWLAAPQTNEILQMDALFVRASQNDTVSHEETSSIRLY